MVLPLGDAIDSAVGQFDQVRASPLRAPSVGRFRSYVYGLWLPIALLSACLRDPELRPTYLRVTLTQVAVTLVVGLAIGLESDKVSGIVEAGWALGFARGLAFASSLYITLTVVEWIIVALSRQHHEQLGRMASELCGVTPEDPPRTPRICVDVRWMWRKLKRRFRGLLVVLSGVPLLALMLIVPYAGDMLYTLASVGWLAYWLAVFCTAKTGFSWRTEGLPDAAPPWFLRQAERLVREVPGFRWWLPRLYVRLWRRLTESIFPPVRELEARPYELAGLTTMRAVASLPGFYLLLRPLIPVAAAHVVMRTDRREAAGHAAPATLGPESGA